MEENKKEFAITLLMILFVIGIIILVVFKVMDSRNISRKNEINSLQNTNDNNTMNLDNHNNYKNNYNDEINIYNKSDNTKKEEKEILKSTYSTNIYDNDTNRVDNIALAISKINGCIIDIGEEFSFNQTVGPMDLEHGFKESTVFDTEGNITKAPGGGMCQISSTMYNAVLGANLEVTERHPHSRRVEYVPIDKDATIYYDTLDFKFKNNSETPIKIVATSDEYNVTVSLYSIVTN